MTLRDLFSPELEQAVGPPVLPLDGQVMSAGAAVAFLDIALVAVGRRAQSPLARELALMSAGVFTYNILEVAYSATHQLPWAWLEYATASVMTIPTLRLFAGFVGMTRRLRWPLRIADLYFALLAASCLAAFVRPSLHGYPGGDRWALLMLVGMAPCFGWVGVLLLRHIRRSDGDERARARLFAAALLLGVGSATTDVLAIAGLPVPKLSLPGLVVAGIVVAALVLKARLLERVTVVTLFNAAILALFAVVALVLVFAWSDEQLSYYAAGAVIVCLALAAALRPILRDLSEHRARSAYLASLGRLAEQMAHDVRNPLAAMRGAAQFLKEERAQGRSMDDHERFVDMIIEGADRLERVVRDYQRMGRVEPKRARVKINALLEQIAADHQVASDDNVTLHQHFADDLPPIDADPDLVANALDNVLRNAREAMPDGGEIHISTALATESSRPAVRIQIRDTGCGMNVRTRELALDDYFTTKADGSGLGLSFVERVVRSHGGRMELVSQEAHGTTVDIELPVRADTSGA